MKGMLTVTAFKNGNGANRSPDREKALSMRAVHEANDNLNKTLPQVGGSLDGLLEHDAIERLAKYGPNEVAHEKPAHWLQQLISCFKNPFIIVLVVIATLQYVTKADDP